MRVRPLGNGNKRFEENGGETGETDTMLSSLHALGYDSEDVILFVNRR
jgi:hypothetical protein